MVAAIVLRAWRPRLGRGGMQRPVRQLSERSRTSGADQRFAGEGAAMAPLGHTVADRLGRDSHADGQAIGDRLREAEDVRHDVLTGEGERTAGPKPGLDLVTYKKDAAPVAAFADPLQVAVGGHSDTALPPDRLRRHGPRPALRPPV